MCTPRFIWIALIGAGSTLPLHSQQLLPIKQFGKWGYMDGNNNLRIPCQFTSAGFERNNRTLAWRNDSVFIIDTAFTMYSPGQFDAFEPIGKNAWKGRRNGKFCLFDSSGKPKSEFFAQNIDAISDYYDLYKYSTHYKTGICDGNGHTFLEPAFLRISNLNDKFITCLTFDNQIKVYHLKTGILWNDSFTTFKHVGGAVYAGVNHLNATTLFYEDLRILGTFTHFTLQLLNNRYATVQSRNSAMVLDLITGQWLSGLPLPATPVCDSLFIATHQGKQRLYHINRGWVGDFQVEAIRCMGDYYEVSSNALWGIADQNFRLIIPQNNTALRKHEKTLMAQNTNGRWAIYSLTQNQFKTPYQYIRYQIDQRQIKAYTSPTSADYFELDPQGNITDSIHYPFLRTIHVEQRQSMRDDVDPYGDRSTLNRQWFSVTRNVSPRLSVVRWGLRAYEADSWRILRKPGFEYIAGLSNGITIAGNRTVSKSAPLPVNNISKVWQVHEQRLISDSTGVQLGKAWNYIDQFDFRFGNSGHYRTHGMGRSWLIDKTTHKPILQAAYISPVVDGVRRICMRGDFHFFERAVSNMPFPSLGDRDMLFHLGLNQGIVYPNKGIWQMILRDGRLVTPGKPEYQVVYISEFVEGYAVFHLSSGLCGVTDTLGREIVPPIYPLIRLELLSPQLGIICYASTFGKYGVARKDGTLLTPPLYSFVSKKGDAAFCRSESQLDCVDAAGTLHPLEKGKSYLHFSKDICFAGKKGKMQVCDLNGNPLNDNKFDNPTAFQGDYAFVMRGKSWNMINRNGEIVGNSHYPGMGSLTDNRIWFAKKNRIITTNHAGKDVKHIARNAKITATWDQVVALEKKKRYALFTEEGKMITRFRFKYPPIITEGGIACISGGTCRFFNADGSSGPVFNLKYRLTHTDIIRGRSVYKQRKNKTFTAYFEAAQVYAWTGENSQEIAITTDIASEYAVQKDYVWEAVQNDVFMVYLNKSYQFLHSSGTPMSTQSFTLANPMRNGYAVCDYGNYNFGILDKYGNWALPPVMKRIDDINPNYYRYSNNYVYDIYRPGDGKLNVKSYDMIFYSRRNFFLQRGNSSGWFFPAQRTIVEPAE